jgi:hypothetical protein
MKITLQYFDGCPNWKLMEQRLAQALVEAQVAGAEMVRERVESPEEAVRLGFRGSPTVLIDGKDPFASEWDSVGLACRVYRTANGEDGLPSVEELRTALVPMGGLGVGELGELLVDEIRGAAFRRLIRTCSAASIEDLATDLGRSVEEVGRRVDQLGRLGRVRLDNRGRVTGSGGLSIGPDRHKIELDGRKFWTWCAYDIVGIFGALRASGEARSTSPSSGAALEVHFRDGRPLAAELVLFRPDVTHLTCCSSVYDEWCPNSNFFESEGAAWTWSRGRGLQGRVLTLEEASVLATKEWEQLAGGLSI